MEREFWQERWDTGAIGFHEGAPNALLAQNVEHLPREGRVLVPLAGKAEDMILLRDRGLAVVGVELIDVACRAFFDDHRVNPRVEERAPFHVYAAAGIELWCGDIFEATPERLGTFDAVYDRAALVALSLEDRRRYVDTITRLLKPGGRIFLIVLRYDQTKADGPPFSVEEEHIRALFLGDYVIEPVALRASTPNPRMQAAGVHIIEEAAYRLTRLHTRTDEREPPRSPR